MNRCSQSENDDLLSNNIRISELLFLLWTKRWIILFCTMLFTIVSALVTLTLENKYTSEAVLAPSDDANSSNLSNLASQFGGIASIAGINLASKSSNQVEIALRILQSKTFLEKFIEEHKIAAQLYAIKSWTADTNSIKYDESIFNSDSNSWIEDERPTSWQLYKKFLGSLDIDFNAKTSMVNIKFEHLSPYIAKNWLDWLIRDINNELRKRDIDLSKKNIGYLEKQLSKTPVTEIKSIFYKLIEEQTKKLMLAEINEEYVFRMVDPPVVSDLNNKSWPNRKIIVVVSAFVGFSISIFLILTQPIMAEFISKVRADS